MDNITIVKCNVLNRYLQSLTKHRHGKTILSWYLVEYCRNARASSPSLEHQSRRWREHVLYGYILAPGATSPLQYLHGCYSNPLCSMNERRPFPPASDPGRHSSIQTWSKYGTDLTAAATTMALCTSSRSNIYISTKYKLMRFPVRCWTAPDERGEPHRKTQR